MKATFSLLLLLLLQISTSLSFNLASSPNQARFEALDVQPILSVDRQEDEYTSISLILFRFLRQLSLRKTRTQPSIYQALHTNYRPSLLLMTFISRGTMQPTSFFLPTASSLQVLAASSPLPESLGLT
ncbi:hypothetical protein KEM48_014329, partial [Puccinia striiformis f. sp. tritici PST-130]